MSTIPPFTIKLEESRDDYDRQNPLIVVWDFGSSGIRCTVNTAPDLPMPPVFQMKATLDIPKAFNGTPEEQQETRQQIIKIIETMQHNIDGYSIQAEDAFATASFRDQKDGNRPADGAEDFAKDIARTTGLEIRILPGEEEGRLATLGILQQFEHLEEVVVADLGGSSLELGFGEQEKNGQNKRVGDSVTFPLGAKILTRYMLEQTESARAEAQDTLKGNKSGKKKKQRQKEDELTERIVRDRTKGYIKQHLQSPKGHAFLESVRGTDWAAVGGALRSIAFDWALESGVDLKPHTASNTIDVQDFNEHAKIVAEMPPGDKVLRGFQRKRVTPLDTTIAAGIVSEVLTEELGAKKVTVSRVSVRDGAAYELSQNLMQELAPEPDVSAADAALQANRA